jgi:hypothetical protein
MMCAVRRKIEVINANAKHWTQQTYVLWFGACSPTLLLVYANSLDDALEECSEWLADNAPGLIMPAWGEEHTTLVKEACEEVGLAYPPSDGADLEADGYYDAQYTAEADLTYTESGYLTAYDWGIALENPSPKEIADFAHGRGR